MGHSGVEEIARQARRRLLAIGFPSEPLTGLARIVVAVSRIRLPEHDAAKADKQDRWGSRHPTVKPVDLIRWLVCLVTPPGGLVLDPFAGSGTTGAAAFAEGRDAILIEREDQYVADIRERMAFYEGGGMHSTAAKARRNEHKPLGGLFDMAPT